MIFADESPPNWKRRAWEETITGFYLMNATDNRHYDPGERFFLKEFLMAIFPSRNVKRSQPVTSTSLPSGFVPVNVSDKTKEYYLAGYIHAEYRDEAITILNEQRRWALDNNSWGDDSVFRSK